MRVKRIDDGLARRTLRRPIPFPVVDQGIQQQANGIAARAVCSLIADPLKSLTRGCRKGWREHRLQATRRREHLRTGTECRVQRYSRNKVAGLKIRSINWDLLIHSLWRCFP